MKDINNAFYFVYTPRIYGDTVIYKYYYEKEIFEKISTIKFEKGYLSEIKIKYFYNPLNKKEYLFIMREYDDIIIIQIKAENEFEFINKKELTDEYISSKYFERRCSVLTIIETELFDIIYNQYNNTIYIIISYFYGTSYDIKGTTWDSNNIRILTFKNDKLNLINTFKFKINEPYYTMKIIYEDKFSQKYSILFVRDNNLQLIDIKHKYKKNIKLKIFLNRKMIYNYLKSIVILKVV